MPSAEAPVNDSVAAASPKGRGLRLSAFRPFVALVPPEDIADEVLVMRSPAPKGAAPYPQHRFPGKRYALADGFVRKMPFNRSAWFSATAYAVGGVASLHAACELARLGVDGGPGYLVCGAVAPGANPRSLPRSKTGRAAQRAADGSVTRRGRPVGLVDAPRHWLVLDLDGVPAGGVDPRRDPAGALRRIRDLLPPALASAAASWQWSSSCCLKSADTRPLGGAAPETVGAHLRVWLDAALDEAGRKSLMARLSAYAVTRCGAHVVDAATAIWNQAIFCAVSLEDGLADPFPGDLRSGLLDGAPEVSLADLLSEIPELAAKPGRAMTPEQRAERAQARTAARLAAKASASSQAPGQARRGHDTLLRAAARQRARGGDAHSVVAFPAPPRGPGSVAYGRGREGSMRRRQDVFRHRALGDIGRLVAWRRENVPGWHDGVPDGLRTQTMKAVSALLSHCVPAGRLAYEIDRAARGLATPEWVRTSWLPRCGGTYIVAAAHLAEAAVREKRDPDGIRIDRCKTALMNLFAPTEEEMLACGLTGLRTEAMRSDAHRRAKGVLTRPEFDAQRAESSKKATRPWVALGVSRATYYRRLKANPPAAAEAAPESGEGLPLAGLDLMIAAVRLACNPRNPDAAATVAAGSGLGDVRDQVAAGADARDLFAQRAWGLASGPKADMAGAVARALSTLSAAVDAASEPEFLVEYLLRPGSTGILARAQGLRGPRVVAIADILAATDGVEDVYALLDALDALRARVSPAMGAAAA